MSRPDDQRVLEELRIGEQRRVEHLKEMSSYAAEDSRMVHLRVTACLALAVLYLTQLPFKRLAELELLFKLCLLGGLLALVLAAVLYFDYASAAHQARSSIAQKIGNGDRTDVAHWWNEHEQGVWKKHERSFHGGNILFVVGTVALAVVLAALLELI